MLAVVAAMREELHALLAALEPAANGPLEPAAAGRTFHRGRLAGSEVVLTLAGIGKVAAAATTALLLSRYAVDGLIMTGTAGALAPHVRPGDVLVARELLQHDLDASPLFPRYEVPLTGRSRLPTDAPLSAALVRAARTVLASPPPSLATLGLSTPSLHEGLVISGDTFVSSAATADRLRAALPNALAVEMEGAAVAQVCLDFGVPFAVLRTVSDRADDIAHVDFARFVAEVAALYARDVVTTALPLIRR